MELTTIHPGAIIGPALDEDASISVGLVSRPPRQLDAGAAQQRLFDHRRPRRRRHARRRARKARGHRPALSRDRRIHAVPRVAQTIQELYPDRKIVNRAAPDWAIRLVAMFGGPARQIINDIGNVKIFDGRKGEALMGHPYITARQSISDTAESVISFGLTSA